MSKPVLQKALLGAGFTVRLARSAEEKSTGAIRDKDENAISEAPQRYAVLSVLTRNLKWRTHTASGTLAPGGALLLSPGERAKVANGNQSAEFVIVSLDPSILLDAALRHHFISREAEIKLRSQSVAYDHRIARLAAELQDELLAEAPGQATYIATLIEQLAIHLLREHAVFRVSSALELSRVGLVDRRIRRAVELMHAQMERELPLEELAAAAYLSAFHFARLFKKLTGASPHAYLAAIRTAEAERLLAETDLSITEVSQQVGYRSSSHFARAFRQATGLTPRLFRSALIHRSTD